jgi:lipopolysaccharide/colanic/teichoic acid biosynthesis glycosyltransferase
MQRRCLSQQDVARLDAGYVESWSLRRDARLVARTVWRAVVPQRS